MNDKHRGYGFKHYKSSTYSPTRFKIYRTLNMPQKTLHKRQHSWLLVLVMDEITDSCEMSKMTPTKYIGYIINVARPPAREVSTANLD